MENLATKIKYSNGNLLPVWFYRNLEFVLTVIRGSSNENFNCKDFIKNSGTDGFPGLDGVSSFYDRLLRVLTALRYCQAVWDQGVKKEFEEALVKLASEQQWKNSVRITATDIIGYMIQASDREHAVKPTISEKGKNESWGFTLEQTKRVRKSFIDVEFDENGEAILLRFINGCERANLR